MGENDATNVPPPTAQAPAWAKFTRSSSEKGGRGYEVGCTSEAEGEDCHRAITNAKWMAEEAERIAGHRGYEAELEIMKMQYEAILGDAYRHDPDGCDSDDCPCVVKAQEGRKAL